LSRKDHQVKIRGFRVELGEIEAVLNSHPGVRQAVVTFREYAAGESRLTAYVSWNRATHGPDDQITAMAAAERISQWREVWDDVYNNEGQAADGSTFNTAGWLSSYTAAPFSREEMAEYVSNSEERVLALHPKKVLDIGCGLGLVLFRVAPRCERYLATDFSESGLRHLEQQLARMELNNVFLRLCPANDLAAIAPGTFDTVVLNSVVQYFPNLNYLMEVLEQSLGVVEDGGSIFIGDVRSLPLLEMFHESVELHRGGGNLPLPEFGQRVRKRMADDEQLALDPAFFLALQARYPRISSVSIQPKRGHYRTELTRFRYDVTLRVGPSPGAASDIQWLDWQKEQLSVAGIRQMLLEERPAILGLRRVYNDRLALQASANIPRSVRRNSVDPEEFWALENELPYSVRLNWAGPGYNDCFDVLFALDDAAHFPLPALTATAWDSYVNEPLRGLSASKLVSSLRRFLQAQLPDHMIPTAFSMVDSFPLTPNGKVDAHALPEPDLSFAIPKKSHVAPRTSVEERLREIWADLLAIHTLGVDDNFFEIGGHSLIATRLLSRVRDAFRIELPLRAIFDNPTIAGLARVVEEAQSQTPISKPPDVARLPRERYSVPVDAAGNLDLSEVKSRDFGPERRRKL
jgi:SAM-dependent methyltransferase